MEVALHCPQCACEFVVADTPAGAALDRLTEDEHWFALGDGLTVEDMIHANFSENPISCPGCGAMVPMTGSNLELVASELLESW